jgi:hypothetical protein
MNISLNDKATGPMFFAKNNCKNGPSERVFMCYTHTDLSNSDSTSIEHFAVRMHNTHVPAVERTTLKPGALGRLKALRETNS